MGDLFGYSVEYVNGRGEVVPPPLFSTAHPASTNAPQQSATADLTFASLKAAYDSLNRETSLAEAFRTYNALAKPTRPSFRVDDDALDALLKTRVYPGAYLPMPETFAKRYTIVNYSLSDIAPSEYAVTEPQSHVSEIWTPPVPEGYVWCEDAHAWLTPEDAAFACERFVTRDAILYWQAKGLMPEVGEDVIVWKHVTEKRGESRSLLFNLQKAIPQDERIGGVNEMKMPGRTVYGNLGMHYQMGRRFSDLKGGNAVPGPIGALRDWGNHEQTALVMAIATPKARVAMVDAGNWYGDVAEHRQRRIERGVFFVNEGLPVALYEATNISDGECDMKLLEGVDVLHLLKEPEPDPNEKREMAQLPENFRASIAPESWRGMYGSVSS